MIIPTIFLLYNHWFFSKPHFCKFIIVWFRLIIDLLKLTVYCYLEMLIMLFCVGFKVRKCMKCANLANALANLEYRLILLLKSAGTKDNLVIRK